MDWNTTCKALANELSDIPKHWNGRDAILEMKNSGSRHWKQMEWMGFFFEFLCTKLLRGVMEIPGPRYGHTGFDAFLEVPWDFKAHAMNTSSHDIVVNDQEATFKAIDRYGAVGLVIALGKVDYNDEERTFQRWHDNLKGEKSPYVKMKEREGAWSRLRKQAVHLEQISYIKITRSTLNKAGSFQRGFKNSNGTPRREKVTLNLEKIDNEIVYVQEF